ncbi:MAG TPA: hypothetical protein VLG40_05030 [Candidatus Saccharimonas sp.]|nr:hypothetical protein [Candidatus Saccharimonas sp.]
MNKLRAHLSVLNDAATRRTIHQFASKYHLVYFGAVDSREDEHQLVRGVTVSTRHIDNHYSVGTFDGHDIMFVQRRNTLTFPGKPDAEHKWLIMQIDLKRGGMPHLFIEAHRHSETFYANMFIATPQFQDITSSVTTRDPQFAKQFNIFAKPQEYAKVGAVLLPEITQTIAQHFSQFDYEIIDDRVYVYSTANVVTLAILQEMLRVSLWLANTLNLLKIPA